MNTVIHLPALRCQMGKWVYYAASMPLQEVAERIVFARDLVESKALGDLLQRNLRSNRTREIANYLLQEDEHFLGALIVAVHKGQPGWLELDVKPAAHFELSAMQPLSAERLQRTVGYLRLEGDEELWALDGQHRLSGIQEAIAMNDQLALDEILVIFVGHEDTVSGKQRTRRLFTTLNRNAKAISIPERIALDEDDACAILTRRLVGEHRLLKGDRVASTEKGQLSPSEVEAFTVITMIYTVNLCLLNKRQVLGQYWGKDKLVNGRRPSETQLRALYAEVEKFWDGLSTAFPVLGQYVRSRSLRKAATHRRVDGGHLLFRPMGLDAFARAYRKLLNLGNTDAQAMTILADLNDYELAGDLWKGVLWNRVKGTVIAKSANRELASDLLLYRAQRPVNEVKLLEAYRKALEDPAAELPGH